MPYHRDTIVRRKRTPIVAVERIVVVVQPAFGATHTIIFDVRIATYYAAWND